MDIKQFKSGFYKQQYQYKSFMPNKINHDWQLTDPSLIALLSQADMKLGELNAFSELVPDIDFFIMMHVSKEATASNRIEGTQTNIEDALQEKAFIAPDRKDDWEEVQNYIKAMNEAINQLEQLPISTRLFLHIHDIILKGVRGYLKQPGEFRQSQNWIGGASINDAVFIPPHHSDLPELMSDLEKFLNNETIYVPDLVRIAIAHYQFETIHPFLDGNGRVGRLLITLYLVNQGILTKPTLYLSDFFERHQSLYYDNLMRVRTHNDLTQWLKFFLEGVRETAQNSIHTLRSVIALRQTCEKKITQLGKKTKTAQECLNYLYKHPIVNSDVISNYLGIAKSTALRLIQDLVRLGILEELTGYKRNRLFAFSDYIDLFK